VRDSADVVLYLVNASEDPQDAGYVAPEMEILEWIGKPVLVLLNQIGEPRPADRERAEEDRWRSHLARYVFVREVLTLDAFARCWVQELSLLRAAGRVLPDAKRPALERLESAWQDRRMETFEVSMGALARSLARAACDREVLDRDGFGATLRDVGKAIGLGPEGASGPKEQAMQRLAQRLDAETRASTDQLIELHGLSGRAAAEVLARVADNFALNEHVSEGKAAVLGGLVSGALTGLAADVASGGLTFGAGLLAGGLLGALGAAGLAKGYNLVRGGDSTTVRWSDAFLEGLFASSLLRYLAVAHFGRGRGDWKQSECPPCWTGEVAAALESRRTALAGIWAERAGDCDTDRLAAALRVELTAAALDLFERLYPGALQISPSAPTAQEP
jgi:hypothetical protein